MVKSKCGTSECHEMRRGYCLAPLQGYECHEEKKEKSTINYQKLTANFPGEKNYYNNLADMR